MTNKPSIVYMGTPEFAVPALEALHSKYDLKAVVTVPDKPKGRGLKLMPSAVKIRAEELGIPILQPQSLKDEVFIEQMKALAPDIICVIAFRILPKEIYEMPKIAAFNIHGSLLPKYRGAAPFNHAIIEGEQITGLTSFVLQEKVDTGSILLQSVYPISENTTFGDLYHALMPLSSRLALDTVELLLKGGYNTISQNDEEATPAPKLFRETAKIDWNKPSDKVKNFIHGYSPVPGAWTVFEGKALKILRVEHKLCSCGEAKAEYGSYIINKEEFKVFCEHGSVVLKEIQPEGKKAMFAIDYIRGFRGEPKGRFE